ncbi:MAG: DUF896 domain-containing protein [Ruminococcus sp.]|nr:DUF896 domain-containing protein [Ruminococcus sp.]MCD7727810.1 DUF896 domain-containing protein [Ruminococcus sp.]
MDKKKLDRISELARISKERKLSESELIEQKTLRDEYRKGFVRNLTNQLENTKILNPDGTITNVRDLKKK